MIIVYIYLIAVMLLIPIVIFGVYEIENLNTSYRYPILAVWFASWFVCTFIMLFSIL